MGSLRTTRDLTARSSLRVCARACGFALTAGIWASISEATSIVPRRAAPRELFYLSETQSDTL